MGKIIDILEAERKRPTAQDWDVVHMYKTGQFYTAYDWSAWIISVISYTDAVMVNPKPYFARLLEHVEFNKQKSWQTTSIAAT